MKLPLVFTTFKPILSKIKNSGISALILLWFILLIFVWWKGETFELFGYQPFHSLTSRWLTTTVLIIIAISFIGWKMIHRLKTLEARQQEDKKKQHNPIQEEIDAQRRYLDHWVNRFKRYVDHPKYEYNLPWYIMLGTTDSGKHTLLKEGGNFSELYTSENLEHHINFTVLNNENAVIICPENQLLEQIDNIENKPRLYVKLWANLLLWVREQRNRQPLNGVIITIDIHQLLIANKQQREEYIALLHNRLQDILEISQAELPVYIVMTKLDTLYGFEAVYSALTKEQREEILGVTFTKKGENWKSELSTFWQDWLKQMNNLMPDLLFQTAENKRSQIFSYIRQIATTSDILEPFFENLISNGGKSFHFLKGVYLTSATQVGKMDDVFVQSASEKYHLGVQTYPIWSVKNVQTYFCYNLFKNELFAFPNLAKESRLWRKHYQHKMKVFSIFGGIAALSLLGIWHYFYHSNYQAGINVLEQVKTFKDIKISDEIDQYGDKQLPLLNPIREATLSYGNYHDVSYLLKDMGLYQGNNIGPYVENTYLRLLQLRFIPSIMNGLLKKLNEAPEESEEKLEILRVMRMLDDKTGRDNAFVSDFMKKYWSDVFKGQKQLQSNLMSHLDYALLHTNWYAGRLAGDEQLIEAYQPYDLSVKEAQKELSHLSIYNRVYQNLKIKANSVLSAPLNYKDEIGSGFESVFIANNDELLRIPRFFTESGLLNYFIKQDSRLIDLTVMDSWVLNLKENLEYSDTDRAKISERISEQYVNDYISTWRSAINNLDIREFETLTESINALEKITGGEQTFKRALVVLSDNTRTPALPNKEGKELQDAISSLDYRLMIQIDHSFSDEKSVLKDADDKGSMLQNIYQKLSSLHRYLLSIENAPNQGKAALKAVQLRIDQHSTDPILELQQLAKTMPQPISRWLDQLAEYTWHSVLKSAIVSLEVEWNDKVVKQYKSYLQDRYPFVKNATQEVPLSEFSRFFAPNGILDSFYQTNLKPFIESDLNQISDNNTPLIREDILFQLELATKIRETFFSSGNGIGVQFAIEPLSMSSNKRRGILNLDGQIIDYSHGVKKQTNIVWPNSMNASVESKLTLVSTDKDSSPRSLSFSGPWAQIKLLRAGKVSNAKNGSFDVRYDLNGGYATYRIYIDESDNPFSWDIFSQFKLPDTLY
ncbi:type VI secretion system membrane subunit TssM [Conservatibacter flavescens]|uniref:Type VI secretion system membrane subunit TssM n=1 Tax=Conservatibacter flavescens TaxID=28161 RepID=A0A2M8S2N9_9PAST|nr:type VI secretion system membrane subunit TssM [Conservatibacter flavescens]PJG85420.1 type VI secretion system membrane subunit TssM [Conservatibacter flavescens]